MASLGQQVIFVLKKAYASESWAQDPEEILGESRFQDVWDDAVMCDVIHYLALDSKLVVPESWRLAIYKTLCMVPPLE